MRRALLRTVVILSEMHGDPRYQGQWALEFMGFIKRDDRVFATVVIPLEQGSGDTKRQVVRLNFNCFICSGDRIS